MADQSQSAVGARGRHPARAFENVRVPLNGPIAFAAHHRLAHP